MSGRLLGGVGIAVSAGALGAAGSFLATRDGASSAVAGVIGAVIGAAIQLAIAVGHDPAAGTLPAAERIPDDRQS